MTKEISIDNLEKREIDAKLFHKDRIVTGAINGDEYLVKPTKNYSIPSYIAADVLTNHAGVNSPDVFFDPQENAIITSKVGQKPQPLSTELPDSIDKQSTYDALGISRVGGSYDPMLGNTVVDATTGIVYRVDLETVGSHIIDRRDKYEDPQKRFDYVNAVGTAFHPLENFTYTATNIGERLLGENYSEEQMLETAGEMAFDIDEHKLEADIEEQWRKQGLYDKYGEENDRLERIKNNIVENIWLTRQNRG